MSALRTLIFLVLRWSLCLQLLKTASAQDPDWLDLDQVIKADPCSSTYSNSPTLNEWLFNLTSGNVSDLNVLLDSGEHCIRNFTVVQDVEGVTISGTGNATIRCSPGMGLAFYNTTGLLLENLRIDKCGMDWEKISDFIMAVQQDINFFFEFNQTANSVALAVGNTRDFCMNSCSITNSNGLGFLGINLIGQSSLNEVVFENNGEEICFEENETMMEKVGGGAIVTYHDYIYQPDNADFNATLNIVNCSFTNNINCGYNSTLSRHYAYINLSQNLPQLFIGGGGGGMSVHLTQLQYGVSMAISDSVFISNTGILGSGALVAAYTGVTESYVEFVRCKFISNGYTFSSYEEVLTGPTLGSALSIIFDYVQPNFTIEGVAPNSPSTSVTIENCDFQENFAYSGTVIVFSLLNLVIPGLTESSVSIRGCTFKRNQAVLGAAIFAFEQKFNPYKPGATLSFENVLISQNKLVKKQRIESPSDASGIIHLLNYNASFIGSNSLEHNEGSALKVDSSLAFFQGNISFINNSAAYGGGVLVFNTAYLLLRNNTRVLFNSNSAGVSGGAIYVHFNSIYPDPLGTCFLVFESDLKYSADYSSDCNEAGEAGVKVMFEENQASLGGMVYGSTLAECQWVNKSWKLDNANIFELFYQNPCHSPFIFDQSPNSLTQVATPVRQLRVSYPSYENGLPVSEISLAPGIQKDVNLAAYDGFGWKVPSAVTSKSNGANTSAVLGRHYAFVEYNSTFNSSLLLLTNSNESGSNVTVSLFTAEPYSADWTIFINIEDCPNGFYFNESYRNCTCFEDLKDKNVYCTEDGDLLGPVNTWVGVDDSGFLNLVPCPFDFCEQSISILKSTFNNYDSQCNPKYNRSGIGCGSCPQNFSLPLGSNDCTKCSNNYLLLIPFFAFYGVFLLLFLTHTKFTVSGGFLNGLLFFSNILSLYAPVHTSSSVFVMFSWLSLKVGIKICFYDGMKPLHLAALSLVFPVYMYLLLLLIYVIAEKSSRFSAWLFKRRCSPTHLFVTIIVMTYASLLESCLQILSATSVIVFTDEKTRETHVRWRLDPSQKYFSGSHGFLAAFAVVILVCFLIPAPVVCMLNASGQHFKFLSRFMPFYDAIWAPFKPQYRYWVSLRMLFRIFPLVFFYLIPSPYDWFLLELFLLIISFLHGVVQPYAGRAQNVFDGFLQLILAIIVLVSLFYSLFINQLGESNNSDCIDSINTVLERYSNSQYIAVTTIIAIAYAACLLMFTWHLWTAFPKKSARIIAFFIDIRERMHLACKRKYSKYKVKPTYTVFILSEESNSNDNGTSNGPYGSTLQVVREPATFSELRESLLEDSASAAEVTTANKS